MFIDSVREGIFHTFSSKKAGAAVANFNLPK